MSSPGKTRAEIEATIRAAGRKVLADARQVDPEAPEYVIEEMLYGADDREKATVFVAALYLLLVEEQ